MLPVRNGLVRYYCCGHSLSVQTSISPLTPCWFPPSLGAAVMLTGRDGESYCCLLKGCRLGTNPCCPESQSRGTVTPEWPLGGSRSGKQSRPDIKRMPKRNLKVPHECWRGRRDSFCQIRIVQQAVVVNPRPKTICSRWYQIAPKPALVNTTERCHIKVTIMIPSSALPMVTHVDRRNDRRCFLVLRCARAMILLAWLLLTPTWERCCSAAGSLTRCGCVSPFILDVVFAHFRCEGDATKETCTRCVGVRNRKRSWRSCFRWLLKSCGGRECTS